MIKEDFSNMVNEDGSTITFEWTERTGGTYNEIYDLYEGATETKQTLSVKGVGEIVRHKEDIMEYEFGRVEVGECFIRFKYDFNLIQFKGKDDLRFIYLGQKWKVDSPLGLGDIYADEYWCKYIKGVKAID